jgi:hypothetical protein
MPIAIFADVAALAILGGATAGSVGSWCKDHPSNAGCAGKKRDILGTDAVPKMRIERQDVGLCNVAQYNFDRCHDQLRTVTVTSSLPAAGGKYSTSWNPASSVIKMRSDDIIAEAKFDGVPPACMDLAGILTGYCTDSDGSMITTCGSACLHYTGLTDDQIGALSKALSTS